MRKQKNKLTYTYAGMSLRLDEKYHYLIPLLREYKSILTLPVDWDQDGAEVTKGKTWRHAVRFLHRLARRVHQRHGKRFSNPDINPGRDGSLDFKWEQGDYSLLINLKKGRPIIHWYGYDRMEFHKNPKSFAGEESKGMMRSSQIRKDLVDFFRFFLEPSQV